MKGKKMAITKERALQLNSEEDKNLRHAESCIDEILSTRYKANAKVPVYSRNFFRDDMDKDMFNRVVDQIIELYQSVGWVVETAPASHYGVVFRFS